MLSAGKMPRQTVPGYTTERRPISEPGLITELQPISARSPITAPNFFNPVGASPSAVAMVISLWSSFTLERITPAPRCPR